MAKQMKGVVISAKMAKTVVVETTITSRHKLYRKVMTHHRKFKAHNELEGIHEGDTVMIQETRPISKEKRFYVVEKITENK